MHRTPVRRVGDGPELALRSTREHRVHRGAVAEQDHAEEKSEGQRASQWGHGFSIRGGSCRILSSCTVGGDAFRSEGDAVRTMTNRLPSRWTNSAMPGPGALGERA